MGFFDRISEGLTRSRDKFKEQMNVLLDRGPDLDEEFWDGLEETLILADVGGAAAAEIVEGLRDQATRKALPDAYAVLDLLNDRIASTFTEGGEDVLGGQPALVLFVGINGTGKTTTVGKLAKEATDAGRTVILGSADTFRAAAIEQLEVWAKRANVEVVTRERGSDPASVCYDTIERAESRGADLVLIDTAGRLHTSADLMRELEKVVNVVRKRSQLPVYTVLVTDATTGQNGLSQAREFDRALDLDGVIVTKLDGTAKGGIALAVSHELGLPVLKIGVGEGLGVASRRVLALVEAGDLAAERFGRSWMIDERSVEERARAPRLAGRPKLGRKHLLSLKPYTLMNRNHAVFDFVYDDERKRVSIERVREGAAWAPLGAGLAGRKPNREDFAAWLRRRRMPPLRPEAARLMRAAGVSSTDALMFGSFG